MYMHSRARVDALFVHSWGYVHVCMVVCVCASMIVCGCLCTCSCTCSFVCAHIGASMAVCVCVCMWRGGAEILSSRLSALQRSRDRWERHRWMYLMITRPHTESSGAENTEVISRKQTRSSRHRKKHSSATPVLQGDSEASSSPPAPH